MNIIVQIFILLLLANVAIAQVENEQEHSIVSTYYYKTLGKTASGVRTTKIKEPFVAISRDLLHLYPMGTYISLEQCRWTGTYKIMDVMNKKYINTIDVFYRGKKRFNKVECLCSKALAK